MNVYKVRNNVGYIEFVVAENAADCIEIAEKQLRIRFEAQYGKDFEFEILKLSLLGEVTGRIDLSGKITFNDA